MTKTTKPAAKPSTDQAVMAAPEAKAGGGTATEVASAAGIGRSTASKVLAVEASAGQVHRTEGGGDGARRLPDRFALASVAPKATKNSMPKASAKGKPSEKAEPKAPDERLKPGQLDGLVLAYLKMNADSGPLGPTTVAKALERSSGALGNCLVRLAKDKKVLQDSYKPRCYSLAA